MASSLLSVSAPKQPSASSLGFSASSYRNRPVVYPNPTGQQISVQATPIDQNENVALKDLWGQQGDQTARTNQSLSDFTRSYLTNQPKQEDISAQEVGNAGDYFNGKVGGELQGFSNQRRAALNMASQQAIKGALRDSSLRRMATGESSANDQILADSMGKIAAGQAVAQSDYDTANQRYLADTQRGLYGARPAMLSNLQQSYLAPANVGSNLFSQNAGNINLAGTMEHLNNYYTQSPVGGSALMPQGSAIPQSYDSYGNPVYGQAPGGFGRGPSFTASRGAMGLSALAPRTGMPWSYNANPYLGSWNTNVNPASTPGGAPWSYQQPKGSSLVPQAAAYTPNLGYRPRPQATYAQTGQGFSPVGLSPQAQQNWEYAY